MFKKLNKILSFLLISVVSVTFASAAVNVVDVSITENVNQEITYSPLGAQTGVWTTAGENQLSYTLTGEIVIKNTHPKDSIQNVAVKIIQIKEMIGLAYDSGNTGFVTEINYGSDYATIYVPDLAAGQNSTYTYTINATTVPSPIDMTTAYDANILSGFSFNVADTLTNRLNSTLYPDSCVYNLAIVQNSLSIPNFGSPVNFTYDVPTLAGGDSSNVVIDVTNRTLTWGVNALGCINATETVDISYDIISPIGVAVSADLPFTNATISYTLDNTLSRVTVDTISALTDIELEFEKYLVELLIGDNATWKITSTAFSDSDITVNLTSVTLWVSTRGGAGAGFTNPAIRDNDTISGADLLKSYNPNMLLNSTTVDWNNLGSEWLFNYTFSSSPIVWMDLENTILDDGVQLTDRVVTYGNNEIYIKEIYIATGYWLEIKKNITRTGDSTYDIVVSVANLGTSPTPENQVVVVYNFIPSLFTLTSAFTYSSSPWFTVDETNATLIDPTYNGTMFQYGLLPAGNLYNTSLDSNTGSLTENNSLTISYSLSGTGEFNFDDLFLTGVDPLAVKSVGGTTGLSIESVYRVVSSNTEYILSGLAVLIAALVFLF